MTSLLHAATVRELTARLLPLLLDASIKGLVVLALAGAATLAMRKASAAARQLVWLLAMASLLVLPVLSVALPAWQVLPGWARVEARLAPGPAEGIGPDKTKEPAGEMISHEPAFDPALEPPVDPAKETAAHEIEPAIGAAAPVPPPKEPLLAAALPWAAAVWALGTLVCLAPLLLGRLSLWRLRRGCRPLDGGTWQALLNDARLKLGLTRPVALLQSHRRTMPMIWGILRPKLLLPAEADHWPAERRWVVLLHELGHAKRWDCLAKLIAHLACAVYWFNPLAWLAFKRLQGEAERACDDLVLAAGSRPHDYAEHILHIASGLEAGMLAAHAGIGMARKSKLEGRLLAILDGRRSRRSLTRIGVLLAVLLVAALVVPVAIMKATAGDEPPPGTQAGERSDATGPAKTVVLWLVDKDGEPVEGALVTVSYAGADRILRQASRIKTGPDGRVECEVPAQTAQVGVVKDGFREIGHRLLPANGQDQVICLKRSLTVQGVVKDAVTGKTIDKFLLVPGYGWNTGRPQAVSWMRDEAKSLAAGKFTWSPKWDYQLARLRVEAENHVPAESRPLIDDEGELRLEFALQPSKDVVGRLLDGGGKPVAGAEVFVATANRLVSIADGKSVADTVSMKTVEDGRFWVRPQGQRFSVYVFDERGFAMATQEQLGASPELLLQPWAEITGRVVLAGKPQAGATVTLTGQKITSAGEAHYTAEARAGEDGKFEFACVPPGVVTVGRQVRLEKGYTAMFCLDHPEVLTLQPGQKASVNIGGTGNPVTGRLLTPEGNPLQPEPYFIYARIEWKGKTPEPPKLFEGITATSREQAQALYDQWSKSRAGQEYYARQLASHRTYVVDIAADGSLRAEDIPAGDYTLWVNVDQVRQEPPFGEGRPLWVLRREFAMGDKPVNLGDLKLEPAPPRARPAPAKPAPGPLTAREVAEVFLGAATAGDDEEAVRLADPNSALPRQLKEFRQIPGVEKLKVVKVHADAAVALAATTETQDDRDRRGVLLLRLIKLVADWRVTDIDFRAPDKAKAEYDQFLEDHPRALEVPATPPAVQESPAPEAAQAFLEALAKGQDETALGLTSPGRVKPEGLAKIREHYDLSQARIVQAFVSRQDACAVTSFFPPKKGDRPMAMGIGLRKHGDRWLVRDIDALPHEKAVGAYVESFKAAFLDAAPAATTRPASPQATQPASPQTQPAGAKATLPGGIVVELLGVRPPHTDDKMPWYAPDGSGEVKMPYRQAGLRQSPPVANYTVAFKVTGLPADAQNTKMGAQTFLVPAVSAAPFGRDGAVPWYEGTGPSRTLYLLHTTRCSEASLDVRFFLPVPKWHLAGELSPKQINGTLIVDGFQGVQPAKLTLDEVEQDQGKTVVTVRQSGVAGDDQARVRTCNYDVMCVAVDDGGAAHASRGYEYVSYLSPQKVRRKFDLPVKDVARLRFHVRPYYSVRFANVSLKPGQKTDVRAMVERTPTRRAGPVARVGRPEPPPPPPGIVVPAKSAEVEAKLTHGGSLRLLALGRADDQQDRWWAPDGSPVTGSPDWRRYRRAWASAGLIAVLEAVHPGASPPKAAIGPAGDEWVIPHIFARGIQTPRPGKTPSLTVGFSAGPWKTVARLKEGEKAKIGELECALEDVKAGGRKDPRFPLFKGTITVSYWFTILPEKDVALLAVDKAGKEHAVGCTWSPALELSPRGTVWRLPGQTVMIDIGDLDHFLLKTRPRAWATFTGFATTPGKRPAAPAPTGAGSEGASTTRPASPQTQPAPAQALVEFSGRVVDAQTGEPIEQFALQDGWPSPTDPSKIAWAGTSDSSRRPGGSFRHRTGWRAGQEIWLRVLAPGYLPQPVTPLPLIAPAVARNLQVRLTRGWEVRGRVLDHTGKPAAGAKVFLAGNQPLRLADGQAEYFRGSQTLTDEDGRFVLTGAGTGEEKVVVSAPSLHAWVSRYVEGKELTVKLPEPAGLALVYDIEGDADPADFRLELKTWEMPDWRGVVESIQDPRAPNKGQTVLKNLTPGVYDLARTKHLRVGDRGEMPLCDRCTITLEPGKTEGVEFVRKTGAPITGQVLGLKQLGVPGAFIYIKPAEATGDPSGREDFNLRTFDALTCGVDGGFKTARIPPGSYTLVAHAYKPPEEDRRVLRTGWRLPDFIGTVKVTVPEDGPPQAVRITMAPPPRPAPAAGPSSPPATQPGSPQTQPAGPPAQSNPFNTDKDPTFRGTVPDNWAVDLDKGQFAQLKAEWPDALDLAWDNDAGGVLMLRRGSAVRVLPLPGAKDFADAARQAIEAFDRLTRSTERGVVARDCRYAAVLTDQGNLAVLHITRFEPAEGAIAWSLGRVERTDGQLRVTAIRDLAAAAGDVADIPAQDLRAEGNAKKRYFLIGPKAGSKPPPAGYRLVIVLPGGDGGADFHPFVKRIYKHALSDNYLVAQPVSVEWQPGQFKQTVWPTRTDPWPAMKFSTEEFVEAVIRDVRKRHKLDPRYVFTLGWSSSGPPCYAISLQEARPVTGSFIAMSVFKPNELPPLKNAAGHAYFILHSPQDFIPVRMAEQAAKALAQAGAAVRMKTYQGGHGWRGDVYGNIRAGMQWLETAAAKAAATQPATRAAPPPGRRPAP